MMAEGQRHEWRITHCQPWKLPQYQDTIEECLQQTKGEGSEESRECVAEIYDVFPVEEPVKRLKYVWHQLLRS